ncbi:MAG: 4a-hydroxytetrahydrobiopterin dehydratase [Candidatus Nanopelagicales bacterium]
MARILVGEELTRQAAELPEWDVVADSLRRTVEFRSFLAGIDCVRQVAADAEAMNHHPDIDIRWRTVSFTLSTHSEGGLTQLDIELAHQINAAVVAANT